MKLSPHRFGAGFLVIAVFTQWIAPSDPRNTFEPAGSAARTERTPHRLAMVLVLIEGKPKAVSTARNQSHMSFEQFDFSEEYSQSPINLLVCDNESLFRELLVAKLENEDLLNIIGSAASGEEAIAITKETKPDVVLMDIELGEGLNGITTANEIKDMFPDVGVVVLSAHRDKEFLASFLDDRTSGWSFLLKQSIADVASLVRAIESASSGQVTMDPEVMSDLFPRKRSILERLTHSQMEALMFIASGYADSAIAEELSIAEDLVEPMLNSIYTDLHIEESDSVDPRVQATLLYLEETAQVS